MPTYRNDGNSHIHVVNTEGGNRMLGPGESVETYIYQSNPDLTKTAETPYWNPVAAVTTVSSTGVGDDQEITLNAATDTVKIWSVDPGRVVTVYLEAEANTPPVAIIRSGDMAIIKVAGRASKLVLKFSVTGSCEVFEVKSGEINLNVPSFGDVIEVLMS